MQVTELVIMTYEKVEPTVLIYLVVHILESVWFPGMMIYQSIRRLQGGHDFTNKIGRTTLRSSSRCFFGSFGVLVSNTYCQLELPKSNFGEICVLNVSIVDRPLCV
ncbi:hypothetical protein LINGRAHAP2_LOCUS8429 [Linum grandiflorum]